MGGWVNGWVVKRDLITHSGSSEHNLGSKFKLKPSVAIEEDVLHTEWGEVRHQCEAYYSGVFGPYP